MGWQEFTIELVKALGWPVVVLAALGVLYRPLRALTKRIERAADNGDAMSARVGPVAIDLQKEDREGLWVEPATVELTPRAVQHMVWIVRQALPAVTDQLDESEDAVGLWLDTALDDLDEDE